MRLVIRIKKTPSKPSKPAQKTGGKELSAKQLLKKICSVGLKSAKHRVFVRFSYYPHPKEQLQWRSDTLRRAMQIKYDSDTKARIGPFGIDKRYNSMYGWLNAMTSAGIKAKTRKYLAVPLRPAMTSRGIKLWPSPARFGRKFFTLELNGRKFLAYKPRGSRKSVFYYILKKFVHIPKRNVRLWIAEDMAKEAKKYKQYFKVAKFSFYDGNRKRVITVRGDMR